MHQFIITINLFALKVHSLGVLFSVSIQFLGLTFKFWINFSVLFDESLSQTLLLLHCH